MRSFLALCFVLLSSSAMGEVSKVVKLRTSSTLHGTAIRYLRTDHPSVTAKIVAVGAGAHTRRRIDRVSTFVYVLEGKIDVRLADGQSRQFVAGDPFVGAPGTFYSYDNPGDTAATLLTWYMGKAGSPPAPRPWALSATETWDGAPIRYFGTDCPEVEATVVTIPAGESTGVHLHTVNNYAYVLRGSVRVETGDVGEGGKIAGDAAHDKIRWFRAREAFAELVNTWHNGYGGPDGVELLVWYTSEAGPGGSYEATVKYDPAYVINRSLQDSSRCKAQSR